MATILQLINADRNLSMFSRGIKLSGLEEKLNEAGPFTILGPVNLAFSRLSGPTYDQLLDPVSQSSLAEFLSGYILTGKKMMHDFRNGQRYAALGGSQVSVALNNEEILINGAKILAHNRQGSNGVIHVLDKTYAK